MKDKPQTIKVKVWSEFQSLYQEHINKALQRKFGVSSGIEGDFLSDGGSSELIIRFLADDKTAENIAEYIGGKWQFLAKPQKPQLIVN